jgi:hypothetical protein
MKNQNYEKYIVQIDTVKNGEQINHKVQYLGENGSEEEFEKYGMSEDILKRAKTINRLKLRKLEKGHVVATITIKSDIVFSEKKRKF